MLTHQQRRMLLAITRGPRNRLSTAQIEALGIVPQPHTTVAALRRKRLIRRAATPHRSWETTPKGERLADEIRGAVLESEKLRELI